MQRFPNQLSVLHLGLVGPRALRVPESSCLDLRLFSCSLVKVAIKLILPKLTFQVLRRSYATRAVAEQKGSLKDVQAQLRHGRPDTTLQNYVKQVPESVFASVTYV